MEGATLIRPQPGPASRARAATFSWPGLLLGLLILAVLIGFIVYPTYPNYDSYYSLIWGRELIHGQTPSFDVYRAPTEHPLAVFLGAVLSLLGRGADRVLVFLTLASLVALAAGMYRLGRLCFTPLVGVVAAALLLTRFDFPFLAARAYIDVPYLAVIIWAAVAEVQRPRRGALVLVLLALAGLMRPEAWVLTGLYWLWVAWPADWPTRIRYAALAAIAPLVWLGFDWAVTGRPLFSLQHTSGLAEELGRSKSLGEVPPAMWHFLVNLDKLPVLFAGIGGLVLAGLIAPRRILMPGALLAAGLGTFLLVGAAGLSVIDRYLLVPSLMVMIFAAFALAGWTLLLPGRWRTGWIVAAVAVVAVGAVYTLGRLNLATFTGELQFRRDSHASLVRVLDSAAVAAGRRCGPVSTPNHKLLPDTRWILDAGPTQVLARSDPRFSPLLHPDGPLSRGVALVTTDRASVLRQSFTTTDDLTGNAVAGPGFRRAVTGGFYGAFVRC